MRKQIFEHDKYVPTGELVPGLDEGYNVMQLNQNECWRDREFNLYIKPCLLHLSASSLPLQSFFVRHSTHRLSGEQISVSRYLQALG
jgi:hypothetical protein